MQRVRLYVFIGIAVLLALVVSQAREKPAKPAPETWQVTIYVVSSAFGTLHGSQTFLPNLNVTTGVSTNSTDGIMNFTLRMSLPGSERLIFSNVGLDKVILSGQTELPCGGIPEFLNSGPLPDNEAVYERIVLWFQLPLAEVNRILAEGGDGYLSGGFVCLSFLDDTDPNLSLYGFTPVENLHLTKTPNGWIIESGQGLDLKEQKTEIITYYVGKKLKTESRVVVLQEILTQPISFRMDWIKTS